MRIFLNSNSVLHTLYYENPFGILHKSAGKNHKWICNTLIEIVTLITLSLTSIDSLKYFVLNFQALLEAQEEAMKNHNVEYKSNLHIGE